MKATVFHRTEHMQEHQLLPPGSSCPFCAATNREKVAVLQQAPNVYLFHCKNCFATSASRMPTPQALNDYYQSYYVGREEKVTVDTPHRVASHILDVTQRSLGNRIFAKQGVSILDFGGGDGSISLSIAEKMIAAGASGCNILLIEYNAQPKKPSDERIVIAHANTLAEVQPECFALVIASAIIEHLPDPVDALKRLFDSLEAGGIFYARTPYMLPFLRLAHAAGQPFDFSYPGHLHDLGARFWDNLTVKIPLIGEYEILRSRPSIVETSFKHHFFRTIAAYVLKSPGFVFRNSYGFVGGWEVFIRNANMKASNALADYCLRVKAN